MGVDIKKRLMFHMLRIRLVEEKIAELYAEQTMRCPVHLCIGQEAVAAGVCSALAERDYVLSAHRSHGHYLAKGGDLTGMLAEFYGKEAGCCRGKGGSMHLVDSGAGFLGAVPIVGSTIPIAAGVALGVVMRGEDRVTIVFFGEGATEEGVFHETLNFSALKNLPVVFVCENNFYSVYSPLCVRQPCGREIFQLAGAHGMESLQGDGNNVLEVYELAKNAVDRARHGHGPVFLEFKTYRWREHCGPGYDNHLGYRTEAEFLEWKARCPIDTFRRALIEEGSLSELEWEEMERDIHAEFAEAMAASRQSPFPGIESLLKDIYTS